MRSGEDSGGDSGASGFDAPAAQGAEGDLRPTAAAAALAATEAHAVRVHGLGMAEAAAIIGEVRDEDFERQYQLIAP